MFILSIEGSVVLTTNDRQLAEDCYRDAVEYRLADESDETILLEDGDGETLMIWTSSSQGDPEASEEG